MAWCAPTGRATYHDGGTGLRHLMGVDAVRFGAVGAEILARHAPTKQHHYSPVRLPASPPFIQTPPNPSVATHGLDRADGATVSIGVNTAATHLHGAGHVRVADAAGSLYTSQRI